MHALLFLLGCPSEIAVATDKWKFDSDPQQLRDACTSEALDAAFLWLIETARGPGYVSEECARLVGGIVGLDWDSFNDEPHDFSGPVTAQEHVVAGVLVAVGDSGLPVAEGLSEDAPAKLVELALDAAQRAGWGESAEPGNFWQALLADEIEGLVYDPTLTPEYDSAAWFDDGTVWLGDIDGQPNDGVWMVGDPDALDYAGLLFHEAAHGVYGPHTQCDQLPDEQCDDDRDGAFGAEGWWYHTWIAAHQSALLEATVGRAETLRRRACDRINDDADYLACADDG